MSNVVDDKSYMSIVQLKFNLADTAIMLAELGRGSGKTTNIMGQRLDRVQDSMKGAPLTLMGVTYRTIFDNIIPGLIEFLHNNYIEGKYFVIGITPPKHFQKCHAKIVNWKHTISFHTGSVLQMASADRPESMIGKNTPHIFIDELLRISETAFVDRLLPALRANRQLFGHSPYFMGMSLFTSTPLYSTDHDWFLKYEGDMDNELINCIIVLAMKLDGFKYDYMQEKHKPLNKQNYSKLQTLEKSIARWQERVNELRKEATFYLRASSFSNIKILGVDYIKRQIDKTKDKEKLHASIMSSRRTQVKTKFFGRFSKEHIYEDSYQYNLIDTVALDGSIEDTARHLLHYNNTAELYAGFDPGPFMSIVFAQRFQASGYREFRAIKNMWVIHPDQHEELARQIDTYFKYHRTKTIYLHYDRAANQRDPNYRKYYPLATNDQDSDAILLQSYLKALGWNVILMSLNQAVIYYNLHYKLLNILFKKHDGKRDKMLIDSNECEELVSSINNSPLKRTDSYIELDKSSEKELDYEDQAMWSTQIASAYMYLLWGEYANKYMPKTGMSGITTFGGTFTG